MTTKLGSEVKSMRVITRGHRVLRTRIERVNDPDYADQWGGHTWYREWTDLTSTVTVHRINDKTFVSGAFDLPHSCGVCDEYVSLDYVDENTVTMKTDCKYVDGITTVVEIDVPSGRLYCNDDLRPTLNYDIDTEGNAGYNSRLGQSQVVQGQAGIGVAYGPCGNSSPSLFEIEPGKYVVANGSYDDDTDEMILSFEGKEVANFCTDLWAFSMVDYEYWLSCGGEKIEDDKYGTRTVVEVPPGRYRMTYHGGENGFDHHAAGEIIYAEFEKIS